MVLRSGTRTLLAAETSDLPLSRPGTLAPSIRGSPPQPEKRKVPFFRTLEGAPPGVASPATSPPPPAPTGPALPGEAPLGPAPPGEAPVGPAFGASGSAKEIEPGSSNRQCTSRSSVVDSMAPLNRYLLLSKAFLVSPSFGPRRKLFIAIFFGDHL